MTPEEMATKIAGLLEPLDDIASAGPDPGDDTLVLVTTQGGTGFLVYVEEGGAMSETPRPENPDEPETPEE